MDRLTSMEVFVKAVDLGSFAAAADALGMSGPMVGKHVRFLEQRLGLRLINRTTRRQNLTEFGKRYYEHCRTVLEEVKTAEALASDQALEPRGRLRVTAPVHFGRHCVLPVLLDLVHAYPALELDLSFNDRISDLTEDSYDLAIRTGSLESRARLVARRMAGQPMIVCASPSYVGTKGRPDSIADLAGHDAIVYHRSGPATPWLFPRSGEPPLPFLPKSRLRFDDLDAVADAVASGFGIAWLPRWLVRKRMEAGTVVQLLNGQQPFLYDCHAVWLQTPFLPQKVRLAVDALAATLPSMMV